MKINKYNNTQSEIASKITPQVKHLVETLRAKFSNEYTDDDIRNAITREEIHTKQDPHRIFTYYRAEMIDAGYITREEIINNKPARVSKRIQIIELHAQIIELLEQIETEENLETIIKIRELLGE